MNTPNFEKIHQNQETKYASRIRKDLDKTRAKELKSESVVQKPRKQSRSIEKVFTYQQQIAEKWVEAENKRRIGNEEEPNATISDYIANPNKYSYVPENVGNKNVKSTVGVQIKNISPGIRSNITQGKTWMSKIDDKPGYIESVNRHLPISLRNPHWFSKLQEYYCKHVIRMNTEQAWKKGIICLPEEASREDAWVYLRELSQVKAVISGIPTNYKKFNGEQLKEMARLIAENEFEMPYGNHIAVRHAKQSWKHVPWQDGGPYGKNGKYKNIFDFNPVEE